MKVEPQRVLAGSLNIVTPSDKTIENDAIDLLNFRVDQAGVLRGGDSFAVLTNVGDPITRIFHFESFKATQAFQGGPLEVSLSPAGAFLIGAGTSLLFFNPSPSAEGTLAGGFSGNPISIVLWSGFFWVLDSNQQLKIDPFALAGGIGAPVSSWLPPVPTTAITATADTSGYTGAMSGSYTYFVTFAFSYVTTDPTTGLPVTVDLESAPGPSVGITAVDGIASITSLPTYSATFAQIRLYRAGGTQAHAYRIKTWTGDGSYPFTVSDASPYMDYASDASLTGNPIAPTSGAAGAPPTPTAAPNAVGGAVVQSTSQDIYTFYVTFVNNAGLETNPGPSSNSVQSLNGIIHLTTIPVSGDASVGRRRIYATGGTLGNAYQITEIDDNTTTTYDALVGGSFDLLITENDIVMPTTNDPPPSGDAADYMGVVGPYFNVLLAWKNNRLFWSQDGVPLFPGSEDGSSTGNWEDVGSADDPIQNIVLHPRAAVIYKKRSIWRLDGDPVTGTIGQTSSAVGTLAINAATAGGAIDFMVSPDGLFLFNLDSEIKQSQKIEPLFMGVAWIGLGASDLSGYSWNPLVRFVVCAYLNGIVLISDAAGNAFIYHLDTGRWAAFKPFFTSASGPVTITAVAPYASSYKYWLGDSNGNLMVAQPSVVAGQKLVWQTRFLDQGLGDTPKIYQEIVLDGELNGCTATVYILHDNTATAPALSTLALPYKWTLNGTARNKFYMPLSPFEDDSNGSDGSNGKPHISFRVEITCVASEVPPAIHGLYIYYGLEARDSGVRATQVLDFSTERISLCRKMEVDAVGQVDLAIWTDTPGGALLNRYSFSGPALSGRGIFEFPLPPNIRGRLWRVDVIPQNTTARVYRVRGWMRIVGTAAEADWDWRDFIDGTPAETPDAE